MTNYKNSRSITHDLLQGYDGANIMSGCNGGVQRLIQNQSPTLNPYVHCASHNLNLVINAAVKGCPKAGELFSTIASKLKLTT